MPLRIFSVVIFATFVHGITAARILQPTAFGIIESNSDNLPVLENQEITIGIDSGGAGSENFENEVPISHSSEPETTEHEQRILVPVEDEAVSFNDKDIKSDGNIDSSTAFPSPSQHEQNLNHQENNVQDNRLHLSHSSDSANDQRILSETSSESITHTQLFPKKIYTMDENKESSILTSTLNLEHENVIEKSNNKINSDFSKWKIVEEKTNSIEDKWREVEKTFRVYTDSVMKKALPKILRIHSQLNVSSQCNSALMQLVSGLRKFKSWAIKMADSSGRLPSGSLEGTLTDLGDYDQCLAVVQPQRNKHAEIRGKYCSLELKPMLPALHNSVNLNSRVLDFGNTSSDSVLSDLSHGSAFFHFMVMRIGICIPSPCIDDDIQQITSALLKSVPVKVSVRNCEMKEESHITIPQFIVISTAVVIAVLILVGTLIDCYISSSASRAQDIGRAPQSLLAFSLSTNVSQLLKTSRTSTLGAVNGVRCLSLMWIVLAHTYGFGHRQGLARLSQAKTYMDDIFFQIITNAWVSVDTFFMIGGLLVANSNLKQMESTGGKINYFSHVLHRVWRLTPPVAATLGVMFLLPLIGSGPLWADMAGKKVANCEERWWQVFLPINTWVDFSSMCLLHTWYVASDMHFYCLAPFALALLFRWPAFGFAMLFMVTAACSLVTGILTIVNNLPPTVIFFSPDIALTKKTANLIYFRPYPHIGAYCVGLALGYLIWKYHKWTLTKVTQSIGWATSSACCLAVLFATYSWSRGNSADTAEGVIYAMLHRTVWSGGVAWVIFVCATGHGGILNRFLSWSIFTPLSRLCYSVYLLHFPVLWTRASWRRTLLNFHHYDVITEFLGILMITLCLAAIFHLAFEAPFLKLEQIWFPERKKSTETTKPTDSKQAT